MPDDGKIVPLFGRGFSSKSRTVTSQLLTNLYREPIPDADKTAMAFYGTPGLAPYLDLTLFTLPGQIGNIVRGVRVVGSTWWLVVGNIVFGFNTLGSVSSTVVLTTNSGRVSISDNGAQLIIVDGVFGYTVAINVLTGLPIGSPDIVKIASANFPNGATTVAFLNGYFIVDAPNGSRPGQFNWCSQYDGTTWSALDFANAESSPDPLTHVFVNFGQLFLFGTLTTEIWAPSGDTAIFRRVGGAGVEWGLAAKWSVDKFQNNSLIFLGKNKLGQCQVCRLDGYTVTPLVDSELTHDMNTVIGNLSAGTGYTYSLDAHSFYQISFPEKSYLYDDLSQSWSVVSSDGGRHFGDIRWEYQTVPYVSDYRKGVLYAVSPTAYTDNGTPIVREIVSKHVFNDLNRFSISELFIEFEPGVGLNSGQGSNPQVMLQWSKDGGFTWGNEIFQTIGALGSYVARAVWYSLGLCRDFVFKVRITDPVKVVITNAAMRVA